MARNDTIVELTESFAEGEGSPGCSGGLTVVPDEAWSYDTRIAFRGEDGFVYVTKETYSTTTSRHVTFIRRALGFAGYSTDGTEHDGWEVWKTR